MSTPELTVKTRYIARIITWVYALATATAILSWIAKRLFIHAPQRGLSEFLFNVINVPMTPSLVSFAVLLLVTSGLIHRKRMALWAVMLFQIMGLSANVVAVSALWADVRLFYQTPHILILVASTALSIVMLVLWRPLSAAFPAPVTRGSWPQALITIVLGSALTTLVMSILLRLSKADSGTFWQRLGSAWKQAMALPVRTAWQVPVPQYIAGVGSLLLGLTVMAAVHAFLRAAKPTDEWSGQHELQARRLLAEFGEDDSLGYTALRRDKLLHFNPTKTCAIAYQVFGSVALASGDPIGDPKAWAETISSWDAQAMRLGWTAAVIACSETGARLYSQECGFDILQLGDEAILHPQRYQLDFPALSDVRKSVRRCRKAGLTCAFTTQRDLPGDELLDLLAASNRWRHGKQERGFSMALGRFGDPADPRIVMARVLDAQGQPLALMTFLPWGRRGLSLDLMRRHPEAPNGVNEFLVSELMQWCRTQGVDRVSLNFAFLRHVFADAEYVAASRRNKLNSKVIGSLDRFWQLQRLYRANAKYLPEWSPRYVALPSGLNLLSVGLAAGTAEGFLPAWLLPHGPDSSGEQLTAEELQESLKIDEPGAPPVERRTSDQEKQREHHAEALAAHGLPAHPVGARQGRYVQDAERLLASTEPVRVVGRIRGIRDHGRVCFADLTHGHTSVQLLIDASRTQSASEFTQWVDSGDLVEVLATPGVSRTGTPSLLVDQWWMLAKAYRPVPWNGLNDPQTRLRNRAMDMIVHPQELEVLKARSQAIKAVRDVFLEQGYTEVETPILQSIHGGASARPFTTTINAYNTQLVLRIAPELALKKLVVAGMGPVFEIGRNFRNEGADATHNPEFTVVEAYCPFSDYHGMRQLTQRVIQAAASAVHGSPIMPAPDGSWLDISGEWKAVTVCDAVSQAVGTRVDLETDAEILLDLARQHGLDVRPEWGPGALIEELYGELVEPATVEPTFYLDFPVETSPLTAPHRSTPGLVERWDLVACGMELGTAYSELTDPLEQRRRLVEQSWKAARGDAEAMEVDEDFLRALELGMPPSGGLGIGLDRLFMALTGLNIRQVLAFPYVKPEPRV